LCDDDLEEPGDAGAGAGIQTGCGRTGRDCRERRGKTYESTKDYGWQNVLVNMLNITLMLTVNLGILNLLPIPALDGGRLVFLIWEAITHKPVPPEKEGMVHFIGLVFLWC